MAINMNLPRVVPASVALPECCPSGLTKPLDRDEATELARLLKAVADPARLQLLSHLRSLPGCESCVCDVADAIGLSQPTASHHLRVLAEAGLVRSEKRGYWTWYALVPGRLAELAAALA